MVKSDRSIIKKPGVSAVPSRASAYPGNIVRVRPRYTQVAPQKPLNIPTYRSDVTRIPTIPEVSTVWQYETRQYAAESSLPSLSLTLSEALTYDGVAIDEIKTFPPPLISIPEQLRLEDNLWRVRSRERQQQRDKQHINVGDHLRLWLLYPGRLEFLLWLLGTLCLIILTGVLVLLIAMSSGLLIVRQ